MWLGFGRGRRWSTQIWPCDHRSLSKGNLRKERDRQRQAGARKQPRVKRLQRLRLMLSATASDSHGRPAPVSNDRAITDRIMWQREDRRRLNRRGRQVSTGTAETDAGSQGRASWCLPEVERAEIRWAEIGHKQQHVMLPSSFCCAAHPCH